MYLNNFIWNPFNLMCMIEDNPNPIKVSVPIQKPIGANEAAIIIDAKSRNGIFAQSDSAEQYVLIFTQQEMVFERGEAFLNIHIRKRGLGTPRPERNVNVKESTLRLIMSIIRGLDNDKNLEAKKQSVLMSSNYDMNKSTLFTEYVSPIASTLTPEQLFLVLFLSAVLAKILDESIDDDRFLERRQHVYQVANCNGVTIKNSDAVIDALRVLILTLYDVSYR